MEEFLVCLSVYGFCFAMAVFIVWSHSNWKGVLLAALTLWIFLFMGMAFLIGRYSTGGPAGAMLLLWMLTGWLFSTLFCGLTAYLRRTLFPSE